MCVMLARMAKPPPPIPAKQRAYRVTYAQIPGEMKPPEEGGPWRLVPGSIHPFHPKKLSQEETWHPVDGQAVMAPGACCLLWEEDLPVPAPARSSNSSTTYLRSLCAAVQSVLVPAALIARVEPCSYDEYEPIHEELVTSASSVLRIDRLQVEGRAGIELINTMTCAHAVILAVVNQFNEVVAASAARGHPIRPNLVAMALCARLLEALWTLCGENIDFTWILPDIDENPYFHPDLFAEEEKRQQDIQEAIRRAQRRPDPVQP